MSARDDAYKDWQSGMKYQEIADKYGVSLSTVKSWATRYWKNQEAKKVATKGKKKLQPSAKKLQPKKRGGQPGNTNSKDNSGGAPSGNTNNYRHGFYYDVLKPEEQAFVDSPDSITEAQRLLNEMALCEIRERNLLQLLAELRAVPTGLAVQSVTKFKKDTSTTALTTKEYILRYEGLLNQTQRTHMRCVKELHQIKMDMERIQLMKLQAGIGENNAEDEAAQEVLMKAIKRALKDEN